MADDQSSPIANVPAPPAEPATVRLRYREAYQRVVSGQLVRVPPKLLVINIDVTSSYTTVIGALPRIITFREPASRLIDFDIENFDNLETCALALMHAQGEYVSASAPPAAIAALNEEGIALRDNLHSDAVALANRGLVNAEPLKDFKTAPGYKNLTEDLVGLSSLIRRSWDKIGARTMITMAELDRAEELSERLLNAVAMRENASRALADVIQKRLQVFTLFVNTYDEVRRAIAFLRWRADDLDEIAPSLYAGRGRGKAGPEQHRLPDPALSTTGLPTASADSPPAVTVNSESSNQTPPAAAAGFPESNPFAPSAAN